MRVGYIISDIIVLFSSSVRCGVGEKAPIPPVLGPTSPSPTLLWSCALVSGIAVFPSHKAKKLASIPSKYSSTNIVSPASPNFPEKESFIAKEASSIVLAITTPFPAAKPFALITIGRDISLI